MQRFLSSVKKWASPFSSKPSYSFRWISSKQKVQTTLNEQNRFTKQKLDFPSCFQSTRPCVTTRVAVLFSIINYFQHKLQWQQHGPCSSTRVPVLMHCFKQHGRVSPHGCPCWSLFFFSHFALPDQQHGQCCGTRVPVLTCCFFIFLPFRVSITSPFLLLNLCNGL
jgi:hypothetical protein